MPWNGSGDFSLSDTIAPATNADANELQAILTDIGVGIDASINADGQSPITGALKGADGTAALPAYAFNADLNSGFYRIGADNIGLSLGGTKRWDFGTSTSALTGALTVSSTLDVTGAATFGGDTHVITSTDAGATVAPTLDLYRNSASPAVSDFLGSVDFNGKDSGAAKQLYAEIIAQITDPTAASEDAIIILRAVVAGVLTDMLKTSAAGVVVPGTLDATGSFAVATNKFTVDASNGNAVAAGTIGGTSITASAALSGATAAGAMLASQAEQETGSATNKVVQPGVQQYHPSACKVWAKFTSGSSPTVSAGYNISSITRNSVGIFVVTFTTAFSSANYCVQVSADRSASTGGTIATYSIVSSSQVIVITTDDASAVTSPNSISVACWGDQ